MLIKIIVATSHFFMIIKVRLFLGLPISLSFVNRHQYVKSFRCQNNGSQMERISQTFSIYSFVPCVHSDTRICHFKENGVIYNYIIHESSNQQNINMGPKILLCRFHCPIFSVNVSPFTSLASIFFQTDFSPLAILTFRWKGIFQFKRYKYVWKFSYWIWIWNTFVYFGSKLN